jgi:collagenase-like PrtC family protease
MFPCALNFNVSENNEKKIIENTPILDAHTFCSICKLKELVEMNITGFKIVGRCLDEEYQEMTTKMYRDLIDLLEKKKFEKYNEKIQYYKKNFRPLPRNYPLHSLEELFCKQHRCYYHDLEHAPYKTPIDWKTWTKYQYKLKRSS